MDPISLIVTGFLLSVSAYEVAKSITMVKKPRRK